MSAEAICFVFFFGFMAGVMYMKLLLLLGE